MRMLRRFSLVVALVALVGAVFALPASAKRRDFVGLSTAELFHYSAAARARTLGAQRAAGVQLLRQDFDWSAIEISPGRYNWAEYDPYMASVAQAGLRVLPVLSHAPSFRSTAPRSGASRGQYPPSNFHTLAFFAAVLVRRYGSNGSFWRAHPSLPYRPIRSWQVWNEPSLSQYWQPGPDPAAYARLLNVVRAGIKGADPRAEVVTAGIPYTQIRSAVPLTRFLRQLYSAGGGSGFNTLAINAYSRNAGELKRTLRKVRRVMRRYGDGRKKVWITEIGWATAGPRHRLVVGAAQGRRIRSSFRWIKRNRKRMRIRGLVYYQWRDSRPYPPTYKDMWGLHTGLVDPNGAAKPGLASFSRAAYSLH
jgi:polysaccharide biosynthesis protein PslG